MKKNFLTAALAFAALTLAVSCKKTETVYTPPSPESAPINAAYRVNYGTSINASGSGNYEYGCKFNVTKNGKITKLAVKMPTAGSYRVTLWEVGASSQTVLAQATITQAAGTLSFSTLTTPVTVTTGKNYLISLWSNTNWYEIRPLVGSTFAYPITQGSISITGYQWVGTAQTPQTFPTNSDNTYVAGLADFEFQADN